MSAKSFTITKPTILDRIQVSQALPEDTGAVMELLYATAAWLKSKGAGQWDALLEGNDTHDMRGAIIRGDVFTFKKDAVLAGVVMLLTQASPWDRELWGDEGHEASIYIHRLAVNRNFAGQQLGQAILSWVESGVQFPGKQLIRLDCRGDVSTLNQFYSGMGYTYKGLTPSGFSKYEKQLSL